MRALNKGATMGMGRKAAGKPRTSEVAPSVRRPKVNRKSADKVAENPNHREDFERLLRVATNTK
jgi:hypothetical protein